MHITLIRWICLPVTLAILLIGGRAAAETPFRIALVQDGPVAHELIPRTVLQQEIEALLGRDTDVVFEEIDNGNWSVVGVEGALRGALERDDINVVLTLGLMGSAAAARYPNLPKPVISLLVGDPKVQKFPLAEDGGSGKKNFVYLDDSLSVRSELELFHAHTRFKHVAVLVDQAWLAAAPALRDAIRTATTDLGAQAEIVPVAFDAAAAVENLSPQIDAVYVTPLLRLNLAGVHRLSEALIDARLVSFSSAGTAEVAAGLLMTGSADADTVSLARRVAIVLQRITLGTAPSMIRVGFQRPPRLAFNLATATAIDFAPTWDSLQDADLIGMDATDGEAIEFLDVLNTALAKNLELEAARYEPLIAADEVRVARAPLLPQVELGARSDRIKEQLAELEESAKTSTDVDLSASQLLYSETTFAGLAIAKHLARASDHRLRVEVLNTVEVAAASYFQLLRATARREVRRQNLALTRDNLALAEVRLRVGHSGRGDVLRWQSRIARERSELFDAQAQFEQSQSALGQAISQPFDTPVQAQPSGLGHVLDFISSDAVQQYVNDPLNWQRLQAFYREHAIDNAPEIEALDAEIAAIRRDRIARKREFFIPEVELLGSYGRNITRSGAGADFLDANLDEDVWELRLRATLPVMTGFGRRAGLSRTNRELTRAEAQRRSLVEAIETRVTIAAQRAGGSHPAIALADEARRNAEQNFALVKEQYSKGAISITELIDAQDAALDAQLASADAQFRFLIDLAALFRAAGDFSLFLDPASQSRWLRRIQEFYSKTASTTNR